MEARYDNSCGTSRFDTCAVVGDGTLEDYETMMWKDKSAAANRVKYRTKEWRPFFCLKPKTVGGYKVWFEYVEAYRTWWGGWYPRWSDPDEFRLTQKQCLKVGIKW